MKNKIIDKNWGGWCECVKFYAIDEKRNLFFFLLSNRKKQPQQNFFCKVKREKTSKPHETSDAIVRT